MLAAAPHRYFLPSAPGRVVLPRERPRRESGRVLALEPLHARPPVAHPLIAQTLIALPRIAPPEPERTVAAPAPGGRQRWAGMLAGCAVALGLALATGLGAWSGLRHELDGARAELAATALRLSQTEDRQAALGTALQQRLQGELADLRDAARDEVATLADALRQSGRSQAAALERRVEGLQRELAARAAATPPPVPTPRDPIAAARKTFAQASPALLYIRTTYPLRFSKTGEEEEQASFGTGFLISPSGVALTARHVLYPWRYDRRLLASQALGIIEIDEARATVSVWLADAQLAERGAGDEPTRFENAYRRDESHASVRILHEADGNAETSLIMTAAGPATIELPKLGEGDVMVFQLIDPERRFAHLKLSDAAPPEPLDPLLVVGFPLSRLRDGQAAPQATLSRVRRAGGTVLELNGALHPGNSGGPVLDLDGRVVGMASAILDSPVYGIAVQGIELRAAWHQVQQRTAALQRRLQAQGCGPAIVDGIPGARTLAAERCAADLAAGP